jgi:hypothetical protein
MATREIWCSFIAADESKHWQVREHGSAPLEQETEKYALGAKVVPRLGWPRKGLGSVRRAGRRMETKASTLCSIFWIPAVFGFGGAMWREMVFFVTGGVTFGNPP